MGLFWWRKTAKKQSFSERFDHIKARLDSASADLDAATTTVAKTRRTIVLLGLTGLTVVLVVLVGIVGPSRWSAAEWAVLVGWPTAVVGLLRIVTTVSDWHLAKLDGRVKSALEDSKKIGDEIDQDANLQSMIGIRAQVAVQTGEFGGFPQHMSGHQLAGQRNLPLPPQSTQPGMSLWPHLPSQSSQSSLQTFDYSLRRRNFGPQTGYDRMGGSGGWAGPGSTGSPVQQAQPPILSPWQRALHSIIDFVAGDVRADETDGPPLVCTFCQTENYTVLAREMATRVHRWLCTTCNQLNDLEGDWDGRSDGGRSSRAFQSRVSSGSHVPLHIQSGDGVAASPTDSKQPTAGRHEDDARLPPHAAETARLDSNETDKAG